MDFNRRNFLKSSALSVSGILVGKSALAGPVANAEGNAVIKRQLGKTDIELPIVSFGVMRSDNKALVKSAFDMGFVHFDTAHGYQEGRNETMLGELFKDIPRDKYILATKVGADGVDRQTGEPSAATTKEGILTKFELSLQRLNMKYVDILYLHGVSSAKTALAPQLMDALDQLKKQGKVRYVGLSTHRNEPDMIQAAIDSNFYNVVLTAINFKHDKAELIKQKAAAAAAKGIGIVAMKTMAGAFMDKERQKPINCSAALKWVMQDPNIHTSIPGIISYEQMMQNFSVMQNLEFTEKEKADLEEAKLVAGLGCNGCNECANQCKKNLPVEDYMRAYMYTYGYRHYENAFSLLNQMEVNPCADCDSCTVSCVKGFSVAEKISDVCRLSDVPRDFIV